MADFTFRFPHFSSFVYFSLYFHVISCAILFFPCLYSQDDEEWTNGRNNMDATFVCVLFCVIGVCRFIMSLRVTGMDEMVNYGWFIYFLLLYPVLPSSPCPLMSLEGIGEGG